MVVVVTGEGEDVADNRGGEGAPRQRCRRRRRRRSSVAKALWRRRRRRTSSAVEAPAEEKGEKSTEFSFTRFLTLFLAGFRGWAIFVDCDFFFLGDVVELLTLTDPLFAVMCVKHVYGPSKHTKMDGAIQIMYPRKNWSSMVLYNCAHPKNAAALTPDAVSTQTDARRLWGSWRRRGASAAVAIAALFSYPSTAAAMRVLEDVEGIIKNGGASSSPPSLQELRVLDHRRHLVAMRCHCHRPLWQPVKEEKEEKDIFVRVFLQNTNWSFWRDIFVKVKISFYKFTVKK